MPTNELRRASLIVWLATKPRAWLAGHRRRALARRWLRGDGIEIGALHNPFPLPARARVRYVDLMSPTENASRHPELASRKLVSVDILDDGETLNSIPEDSLDFVIGSHFLEHTQNPIGTIRNHASKLRTGGVLLYALPDKRHTFDRMRALTSFDHLVRDDRDGPECSRWDHYRDFAEHVDGFEGDGIDDQARRLQDDDNRIHFHVFDTETARTFFERTTELLEGEGTNTRLRLVEFRPNGAECLAILRRV